MENSSKALTIAGGVLIGILVTTLLILGLSRLRSYENRKIATTKNEQTSEFNSQFNSYNKNVVTGYEMISLARLAEDTNKRMKDEDYVDVNIYMKVKNDNLNDDDALSKCIIGGYLSNRPANYNQNEYNDAISYSKYYTKTLEPYAGVIKYYNEMKKFKEAYFKCDKVEYDDKVDANHRGSGRIIAMYFSEITKKE